MSSVDPKRSDKPKETRKGKGGALGVIQDALRAGATV